MTALGEFERLESLGLWRETRSLQKKEVVVSFGKSSLVLSDTNDVPLAHWSLSAIEKISRIDETAVYSPDKNGEETLEINDTVMVEAIEKIRKSIRRPKKSSGRLRILSAALVGFCAVLLAVFWLPNALSIYATGAINKVKAREIGAKMMPYVNQYAGRPCQSNDANHVLRKLEDRLLDSTHNALFITDLGASFSTHLPGGIILVNRKLVENYSDADALSGFVLLEKLSETENPALKNLFLDAGALTTLSFLVTGNLKDSVFENFVKSHLLQKTKRPSDYELLKLFKEARVSSTAFAKVMDGTLVTTQTLIDDDPYKRAAAQVLSDGEWLTLQSICDG